MAFSKAHVYATIHQRPAYYAKALGHPERIAILQFLKTFGPAPVCEIAERSPLHASVVSQHLGILRDTGLVSYEQQYPFIIYRLNTEVLDDAYTSLHHFIQSMAA